MKNVTISIPVPEDVAELLKDGFGVYGMDGGYHFKLGFKLKDMESKFDRYYPAQEHIVSMVNYLGWALKEKMANRKIVNKKKVK